MKQKALLLSAALSVCAAHSYAAQITSFSPTDFVVDPGGSSFTDVAGPTTYTISSSTDVGVSFFASVPDVTITGDQDQLEFTGKFSLTATATSLFSIDLYDANGNSRQYRALWSDFTPKGEFVTVTMDFFAQFDNAGTFDNHVVYVNLQTGGNISTPKTIYLEMDNLSSIPEPSSLGLLAFGVCALAKRRRRA